MGQETSFQGRVAIVTAAAAGIGLATARRLAGGGAQVVLADVDQAGLERAAGELAELTTDVLTVRTNGTRGAEAEAMVKQAVARFGQLNILVNVVGGWTDQPRPTVQETTEEAWTQGLALNVTSTFLCSKAAIPHLIQQGGGRIVNVGSLVARGQLHLTAPFYAAGKAAVHALTRYLAKELGPHNITVNVVAPGPIWAPRTRPFFSGPLLEKMLVETPLGRIGEPEDVAEVITFLASDAARHITGATIDINGGYLLV